MFRSPDAKRSPSVYRCPNSYRTFSPDLNPNPTYTRLYTLIDLLIFAIMGVVGGLIGAAFNELNMRVNRIRIKYINGNPMKRVYEVRSLGVERGRVRCPAFQESCF